MAQNHVVRSNVFSIFGHEQNKFLIMKKLAIVLLSIGVVFSACKKEEDKGTTGSSYPTDGLTVSAKQRVLVVEHTGAWCQYCPNGAVIMTEMIGTYNDDIIPIVAHDGDPLAMPATKKIADNYPAAGYPNFYVMNTEEGQSPSNAIAGATSLKPVMGVTHAVVNTDSSWNVYPRIEVFESSLAEDYLVNSYILLSGIVAKEYSGGTIDLNQTSSVAVAGGVNPTKWLQDAAIVDGKPLIKAGSTYMHNEALVASSNTSNPFGFAIAEANPFGTEYIEGDILGTKNTPILLSIPKFSPAPFVDAEMTVVTIIWRLRTDGSGAYDYVNGYMSHLAKH